MPLRRRDVEERGDVCPARGCWARRKKRTRRVTSAARATYGNMSIMASASSVVSTDGQPELHAPPGFLGWVAELVHIHRSRLLAYARRRGLDAEEALDAVQDCFISFLRLPEARAIAHEGDDSLKMLTVLLRHNLQNHRRKRARRSRAHAALELVIPEEETETSEALVARSEELARVRGCILRMARLQRDVVMLSLLDERPHGEIAKVLGISDGYMRVLLHRAREHVRNCPLDEEEDFEA